MNPMITNLAIMFVVNKMAGKLDFEDQSIVNIVRACYIVSNVIILGIYMFCKFKINKKNDLTILKYEKPPAPFSQEEPTTITTTVKAYDLEQISSALKSYLMGVVMMTGMHIYKKYTNPLVLQSIMPLKSALENKIVQIHLLGRSGPEYVRPFKAPSMLGDLTGQGTEEAPQPAKIKAE